MAKGDVITVTKDDLSGGKSFKRAKNGKYRLKIDTKKSKIKPAKKGKGNNLELVVKITKDANGKKTEAKGVSIYDTIAPHVGWKIANLVLAVFGKKQGLKLLKKKLTLQELLKLLKKITEEIRGVVITETWRGKKRNKIRQYLPLEPGKDEEEEEEDEEDDDDSDDEDDEDEEDEDDDEEDDEEDEEPAPPVKRGAKKAPAKKATPAPAKKAPVKKAAKKGKK